MNYSIWVGLTIALVMTCLAPNPMWWMILVVGIGANGVVVAANGWKMPVRGLLEEGIRHAPMTAGTRRKWLGDIIPTGAGKASLGDFIIAAGAMGGWATRSAFAYDKLMLALCLLWWGSGWASGFGLFKKWPREVRQDAKKNIPIVFLLMAMGNLLNIRGCSTSDLHASAKAVEAVIAKESPPRQTATPQSKWRDLGKLTSPSFEMLTRLKQETAKQERQVRDEAVTAVDVAILFAPSIMTRKSARSGPFCRMTCLAHHGGEYDVETVSQFCRANWIPPTAQFVPGWYSVGDSGTEFTKSWPGPAIAGFDKYKLYWSGLQSAARVVHRAESQK